MTPADVSGRISLRERRILVVEDEYLIARAISACLEEVEADVVGPVGDVAGALHLIEAERIDAALLDVNLRGVRSYPIADLLMERDVPFLCLSGYERDTMPARYHAFPWCQKPFTASALIAAVAALSSPQISASSASLPTSAGGISATPVASPPRSAGASVASR